jgi:hypothetical protein
MTESVSREPSYLAGADATIAAPYVVHSEPLVQLQLGRRLPPTNPASQAASSAQPRASTGGASHSSLSVEKMFVDESNGDLVVIGDGEVFFFNCVLSSSGARKPGPEESSYPSDVVHLVTRNKPAILVAKRNSFPTVIPSAPARPSSKSFIIGVMHGDRAVHFYLPAVGARSDICEPFLVFRCSPKTLRFRNDDYPLRTLYWQELPASSAASTEAQHQGSRPPTKHVEGDTGSMSAASSALSSRPVLVVVLSEICIDLVRLSGSGANDSPGLPRDTVATVVKRVTTQIHYWSYDAVTRVVFLLNQNKPTVGKPFKVERSSVLSTLPQIKLDSQHELGSCSPSATALMDAPRLQYQIAPVELYGSLYVYQVTPRGQIVLYAYVKQRPGSQVESYFERRLVLDVEGYGDSPEQSPVRPIPQSSFSNSSTYTGPNLPPSFASSQNIGLPSVKIQVTDNLIVAHYVHLRRTGVYDVSLAVNNTLSVITPSGDAFASPATTSPIAGVGDSPVQPAPPAAALRQSYRNPTSPVLSDSSAAGSFSSWRSANNSTSSGVTLSASSTAAKYMRATKLSPLQMLPHHQGSSGGEMRPTHHLYDFDFYVAGPQYLPLLLDRETMQVMFLNIDAKAIASGIRDVPMRVQFLLNRFACGGDAVPELITKLLREHEPATTVAQIFDLVSAHNFVSRSSPQQRLRRRHQLHHQSNQSLRPPMLVGSPMVIARLFLPHATCLLTQEVVAQFGSGRVYCNSSSIGGQEDYDSATLDQSAVYRKVFAPLSEECSSLLPLLHDGDDDMFAAGRGSSSPQAGTPPRDNLQDSCKTSQGMASPTTSVEVASQYAASYLLYALLEYARSLIQHGDSLSDSIQRCIVNMFLQTPPNYFRLHQLLMYRAVDDHIPTALQLITLESQYAPAFQMGLDMLSRLGAQNEIVQVLVAKRLPLAAAKYVFTTAMRDAPVLDILFCASLLHDEEIARRQNQLQQETSGTSSAPPHSPRGQLSRMRQAKMGRKERAELSPQGAEFHTIFTLMLNYLLGLGDETVMMQPAFEVYKVRYNKISAGQLF